ncbi:hypothetical protein Hamer_G013208 [Homarus americanus]|uniref:Uncharacterized protein n=1 Tax=Homarus americanus TaxID=6706 RepID=A0A8J5N064_HOMAM|nr:hypothetical protein Hamer_G013208 [Homarus americanus]
MSSSVTVLLTVAFASFISALDFQDGCTVHRGMEQTVLGSSLNLMLAEPLDKNLWVTVTRNGKNFTLGLPKEKAFSGQEKWTQAKLQVFPKLELFLAGQLVASGPDIPHPRQPLYLVMANVQFMTDCPQGQSIWNLTVNDDPVEFRLEKDENFTILATEAAPLLLNINQNDMSLCMNEEGTPLLKMSTDGMEVKENMTGSIYVAHPLPTDPKHTSTPVSLIVVVLSAVLSVVGVLLVLSIVVIVLLTWLQNQMFPAKNGLPERQEGNGPRILQSSTKSNGPQEQQGGDPWALHREKHQSIIPPQPPRRQNFTSPPAHADELDYVTAKEVKPVEVEILKHEKFFQGNISHNPESSLHSSASRQCSSDASHSLASRKQSSNTTDTTYPNEEDYVNIRLAPMGQRLAESCTYDTVENIATSDYNYCDMNAFHR